MKWIFQVWDLVRLILDVLRYFGRCNVTDITFGRKRAAISIKGIQECEDLPYISSCSENVWRHIQKMWRHIHIMWRHKQKTWSHMERKNYMNLKSHKSSQPWRPLKWRDCMVLCGRLRGAAAKSPVKVHRVFVVNLATKEWLVRFIS